jgi:glucokinase
LDGQRVIGVDLGGTKILAGVVDRDGQIERQAEVPTPLDSQDALLGALEAAVLDVRDESIAAVGFGIPSRLNQKTGQVEGSVNIPLEGLDLRTRMSRRFGIPVGIEKDANAATLGEFHVGAGRGADTMVMLTLGTGCGGGVVLDGKLFRGWAELGHMVVEYNGLPCQGSCTGRGHLEPYVTGTAATKFAREAFGPDSDSRQLLALASEGDAKALEILDNMGRHLGAAMGSLANIFDPELIVIGGGFAVALEFMLEPATEVMRLEALAPEPDRVRVRYAELGHLAGLIGAGFVAFAALE